MYQVHRSSPFPRSMYGTSFESRETVLPFLGCLGVMIIGNEQGARGRA